MTVKSHRVIAIFTKPKNLEWFTNSTPGQQQDSLGGKYKLV